MSQDLTLAGSRGLLLSGLAVTLALKAGIAPAGIQAWYDLFDELLKTVELPAA